MKTARPFTITLLVLTILFAFLSGACNKTPQVTPRPTASSTVVTGALPTEVMIANPASLYCLEQGGQLDIREGTGGQYGVCLFSDGSECEEWDYFKGYCQPGQPEPAADPSQAKVRETVTPDAGPGPQEQLTTSTATPAVAAPTENPSDQRFIPPDLAVITPENVNQLEIVAALEVPGTYWTAFSPDSRRLATIIQRPQERDWQIVIWDLVHGTSMYSVPGGPTAFFSHGSVLAAMVAGHGFTIVDSESGMVQDELIYPEALALAPDRSYLVTSREDAGAAGSSILAIIETLSGESVYTFSIDGVVVAARFSQDGELLAITTGGITSEAVLWDLESGDLLTTFEEVDRLTFSPGSDMIAGLFGPMKEIRVLECSGFETLMILDNSAGPQAKELAFSSDGRLLAASLGNKVRIWDVQSGVEATTLEVQATNIDFAANGGLLVTSSFQGEVLLWAVAP